MAWEKRLATAFGLDDEGWARHANPASGLSRMITGIPVIALAAWSRTWIGWWWLLAMAAALAWLWLNPRSFSPARDDSHWMTRGVLGERLWVERKSHDLRPEPAWLPGLLNLLSGVGGLMLVAGLYLLDLGLTVAGGALSWSAKTWFILRMKQFYDVSVRQRRELRYVPQ